jgi:hypothetical protein
MIGLTIDATTSFNATNTYQIEVSGWENVIIQMVGPSGTIALQGSNDGGAQTGTIEDSPQTATNFTTIVATKMLDGTTTSNLATAGLYKLSQPCKYLKFGGAAAAATKVLVFLSKVV